MLAALLSSRGALASQSVEQTGSVDAAPIAQVVAPSPAGELPGPGSTFKLVGTFQPQMVTFSAGKGDPGLSGLEGGTELRRTDIGLQGRLGNFGLDFVVNVAAKGGAAAAVTNATISYAQGPWAIAIGQQNQRVGFEGSSSTRTNTLLFMEKASPADLIGVAGIRQVGARISAGAKDYSVSAGVFGLDVNNNGISALISTGWATAGRITAAVVDDGDRLLHVGISGFYRENPIAMSIAGGRERRFRARASPEMIFDGQRILDTGNIPDAASVGLANLEGIGQVGSLLWQAEHADQWVQRHGADDLHFSASSVSASYMLTGEQRSYVGNIGQFARFSPRHALDNRGHVGAVELAIRWSRISLHDSRASSTRPGSAQNWTLGLNWILSSFTRVQVNWVQSRVSLDKPLAQPTSLSILGIKVQHDW